MTNPGEEYEITNMRRAVDILVSTLILAGLAPLLLLTGLAVVADSPGSPLYFAERCGLQGRRFRMWKFRTMVPNAGKLGPAITGSRDPRITRLGRFLRVSKVDELPQFVNVLLGDMTLVGPRPEAPGMVALYTAEQRRVLDVKPGVTGRVQLAGEESEVIPAGAEPEQYYVTHLMPDKLRSDLEYLATRSPWSDARIVFDTVGFVFKALVHK
ncbi:MAG TPA: sugar transferase [Bryobacteraceae bacterium]|nr:sugar transferase [Bryobacteraceae bacterium]